MLKACLQLVRIPNVFTAMADVTMGFLFVHASLFPVANFVCLLLGSCFLYSAGMVLNDVYDVEVDTRLRPQRPLPSGRISLGFARQFGYGLLLLGVVFGWLAGYLPGTVVPMAWRSGCVASALAVCIVLYDARLKVTLVGPVMMGSCRLLNILLGMSLAPSTLDAGHLWWGFDPSALIVAGGMGLYVTGVTWFARGEAEVSRRDRLILAMCIMIVGLVTLAWFPDWGSFGAGARQLTMRPAVWALLVALLGFSVVRRCAVAVVDPGPRRVQLAVKQCILSLIVLDAAICLAVRTPLGWSLVILSLLVPTLLLGRWVSMT